MIRRTLLAACTVLVLWAAPAAAQYAPDISGGGLEREEGGLVFAQTTTFVVIEVDRFGVGGDLARTGSDNLVPMVQGGLVLIGGGSLLALVARRRRSQRQLAAS